MKKQTRSEKLFQKYPNEYTSWITLSILILMSALMLFSIITITTTIKEATIIEVTEQATQLPDPCELENVICGGDVKEFTISAYNTVEYQTDDTPCIAGSGDDICGRTDVIACPREYPFGTNFIIEGKEYECLDRLARKYDDRIDISFDKDIQGAKNWGIKNLAVIIK